MNTQNKLIVGIIGVALAAVAFIGFTDQGSQMLNFFRGELITAEGVKVVTSFEDTAVAPGEPVKLTLSVSAETPVAGPVTVSTKFFKEGGEAMKVDIYPGPDVTVTGEDSMELAAADLSPTAKEYFAFVRPKEFIPKTAFNFGIPQVHAQGVVNDSCASYVMEAHTSVLDGDTGLLDIVPITVDPALISIVPSATTGTLTDTFLTFPKPGTALGPLAIPTPTLGVTADAASTAGSYRVEPTASLVDGSSVSACTYSVFASLATTQCNDGIDNDADGFVDLADPDCTDPKDDSESEDDYTIDIVVDPNPTKDGIAENTITITKNRADATDTKLDIELKQDELTIVSYAPGTTKIDGVATSDIDDGLDLDFSASSTLVITVDKIIDNSPLGPESTFGVPEIVILTYDTPDGPGSQDETEVISVLGPDKPVAGPPPTTTPPRGGGGPGIGGGFRPGEPGTGFGGGGIGGGGAPGEPACEFQPLPDFTVDSDGDGLPDRVEEFIGTDIAQVDTDGDEINDYEEFLINSHPIDDTPGKKMWEDIPSEDHSDLVAIAGELREDSNQLQELLLRRAGANKANWKLYAVTGLFPAILTSEIYRPGEALNQFGTQKTQTFKPDDLATRFQLAYMLHQVLQTVCGEDLTDMVDPPWPDLKPEHRFYEAFKYLYNVGVVEGYEDGKVRPYRKVQRDEAIKMIIAALGLVEPNLRERLSQYPKEISLAAEGETIERFSDVPPGQWYEPFVNSARIRKIVKGYTDLGLNEFMPGRNITRAELAEMVRKGFGIAKRVHLPPTEELVVGE